jgi:predicted secreted protein
MVRLPYTAYFPEADSMNVIGKERNKGEVILEENSLFQIELPARGCEGLSWYLDKLDCGCLELLSESTRCMSGQDKRDAPVVRIFQFRAKKEGTTEVKLFSYRAWEGKETATECFSTKIIIRRAREELL